MKIRSIVLAALLAVSSGRAQIPQQLNYQGRVSVQGVNFNGAGQFKFALVDGGVNYNTTATAFASTDGSSLTNISLLYSGSGYISPPTVTISAPDAPGGVQATAVAVVASMGTNIARIDITNPGSGYTNNIGITITVAPPPPNILVTTYWSNDGTGTAGAEPTAAVSLPVTGGLYSVALGDTALAHMTAVPASVFTDITPLPPIPGYIPGPRDVRLRVWFDDGTHGFQQLAPDQRINAAGFAMLAGTATTVSDGAITGAKIQSGAVALAHLADGAVGTAKLANGSVSAAKIADSSVSAAKIVDGSVSAGKLAAGSVESAKLAPGAAAANLNAGGSQNVTLGHGVFGSGVDIGMSISNNFGLTVGVNNTTDLYGCAFGSGSVANGTGALATGLGVRASSNAIACGSYNALGYLFSVGIGSGDAVRDNRFDVGTYIIPAGEVHNGFLVVNPVSTNGARVNGDLFVTNEVRYGGSLVHTSDARLKDLGRPFASGLEAISRMQPLHYRFKAGNPKLLPSGPDQIGVVAQALRDVLPDAVVEDPDGYLAVKQEPVFWALVNAVKELKTENDKLRTQVATENAALSERLEALEARHP